MRCRGNTKSGARCKRSAAAGSEYCGTHKDQGAESVGRDTSVGEDTKQAGNEAKEDFLGGGAANDGGTERTAEEWWDVLADVAMVGTVIAVAVVFGRVLRVL